MSFVFVIDGTTVWSPSLTVGTVWARTAETLAQRLQINSGFTYVAEDMIDIDSQTFREFASGLIKAATTKRSSQLVLEGFVDAVVPPALVILERAGNPLEVTNPAWRDKATRLAGMPQ